MQVSIGFTKTRARNKKLFRVQNPQLKSAASLQFELQFPKQETHDRTPLSHPRHGWDLPRGFGVPCLTLPVNQHLRALRLQSRGCTELLSVFPPHLLYYYTIKKTTEAIGISESTTSSSRNSFGTFHKEDIYVPRLISQPHYDRTAAFT